MPSMTVQRSLMKSGGSPVQCPHCQGHFYAGGQADDDDDEGEVAHSYEDEREEDDRGMRAVDVYSRRGQAAEAGFSSGGEVMARQKRLADKGGESNSSFTSYLAKRRGVRAEMRKGR